MTVYKKLVRDRIPELITVKGERCLYRALLEHEIDEALASKVSEEALELIDALDSSEESQSRREKIIREMADVLEVFRAVLTRENIPSQEVLAKMHALRAARGGFDKLILLEEAD